MHNQREKENPHRKYYEPIIMLIELTTFERILAGSSLEDPEHEDGDW